VEYAETYLFSCLAKKQVDFLFSFGGEAYPVLRKKVKKSSFKKKS